MLVNLSPAEQKFWLKRYFKILQFLPSLLVAIGFSSVSTAQNFNSLSSQISKKNLEDIGQPTLVLNGIANFSVAANSQNHAYETDILSDQSSKNYVKNRLAIGNDTQLFVKAGLKNSKKHVFGAIAKLEFNYNSNSRNESPNLDQSFLFTENDFGRFEFGNYFAVNQKMKFAPAQIARGAGGINGKYLEQVNLPILTTNLGANAACLGGFGSSSCANLKMPRFITLAQSPIGHGGYAKSFYRFGSRNDYGLQSYDYRAFNRSNFRALKDDSYDGIEDATKFSFYSPRIEGLQLGLSYGFSSKSQGATKKTALDVDEISLRNIFSFGANYSQNFDNLEIKLSLTGEHAKQDNSNFVVPRRNLNAYDLGVIFSYFGFSFSTAYGSWGKSLQPKNGVYACDYDSNLAIDAQNCSSKFAASFKKAGYVSAGLSYEIGPIGSSITAMRSNFQSNKFSAVSFGIDYKIRKNLVTYFEITRFAFASNQLQASNINNQAALANSQRQVIDNQGNALLVGTYYSF